MDEIQTQKPRVFISHSSDDKNFASNIAISLRSFGSDVWYDEWEIAVGDSIVEKVFSGLQDSDTLIIVLSPVSVASRWVKEELNTAVMRRISENNIRILPVVIADCDIPTPLRHIRYADFRKNYQDALDDVLESLSPGHRLWKSLSHLYDHFCLLSDQIAITELDRDASDTILKIHSLLESALDLRTEIEFRRTKQRMKELNFFEKIGFLVEKGIDIRSQTWNALLYYRANIAHEMHSHQNSLYGFVEMLKERYKTNDYRDSLIRGMARLRDIMHVICFEQWDFDKRYGAHARRNVPNSRLESDEE